MRSGNLTKLLKELGFLTNYVDVIFSMLLKLMKLMLGMVVALKIKGMSTSTELRLSYKATKNVNL